MSDYFSRIRGAVNFSLLQARLVVVVGVGMVGSRIAEELANCGVGRLLLIDHDRLELPNLARHALDVTYLGWNKAEAMKAHLTKHIDGLEIKAIARKIDRSVPNGLIDQWLNNADLVVAATDDRNAQRRIGRQALVLGVPSIFPSLYPVEGGGEIVVQVDDQLPCFSCWDEFRQNDEPLRGVTALNMAAFPVIYTSLRLCLGILDPRSEERGLMNAGHSRPPYQQFGVNRFGTLRSAHLTWRSDCPACGGGPASSNRFTHQHPDDPPRAQVLEGLRQRSTQRPPASPPELRQEDTNPILLVIGGFFTFIAGIVGLIGAAIGALFMGWLALVCFCLCAAAIFAVAGGAFWLFIMLLGHG
jgi:ThiF family